MSERERGEKPGQIQHLIEELWPCPEPPRDLAERVLTAMVEEGLPGAAPARPAPAPAPRRMAPRTRMVAMAAAAAGLVLVGWWAASRFHRGEDLADAQAEGQLVADLRQTVSIGARAAAAVEPGAHLAWSVRGKRARVDQRRGSVFYRVERGGPFQVVTPTGEVEVTGTCFRVTLASSAATVVSVLEGGVKVHTDAGELALGVGQSARLAKGRPPELMAGLDPENPLGAKTISAEELDERVQRAEAQLRELERQMAERAPEAPPPARKPAALLLPMSPRLRVYGTRFDLLKEVSLALPRGRDVRARVEVARDPEFKQEIFRGAVHAPYVTVPAPERGDLYWRFVGDAAPAGHARFLPDGARSVLDLGSPHNLVSDGRQNTTVYFQGAPPALTLAFTAAPEADRYRVRVYRKGALDRPVLDRVVAEPRCSVAAGALAEGGYVWSALPLDAAGRELGGGRLNKLELVYDNALSALAISTPRPGQVVAGRGVDVRGVAPLGARLFINGRAAALDAKGRFSLQVGGAPRLLVFRLLGRDGAESFWVRHLKPRS